MFNRKKLIYISILLLIILFNLSQSKAEQIKKLSSSFIDPSEVPLVIYGIPFSESVIFQDNRMYAPLEAYLEMIGVKAYLQRIPHELILNGRQAPVSLLAAGPDRYTGEPVYYLDVTETLNFLSIYYSATSRGNYFIVRVEETAPQSSARQGEGGTVSGQVIYNYFEGGSATLFKTYLNTARIPQTETLETQTLGTNRTFSFRNIPPGEYIIQASCYYTVEGLVYYDNYTRQYYKSCITYIPEWKHSVIIKGGEEFNFIFTPDKARVRTEEKLIYLGSPGINVPNY